MVDAESPNTNEQFDIVGPRADALMESLRATGYSLPDAIADLIDNSLTAAARNVWVNFHWAGLNSWVSILDDGSGMNRDELVKAMRIGSKSPLEERTTPDLGRYGLGLKTASISQARSLTVGTKNSEDSEINVRRWDLDHITTVQDWQLLRSTTNEGTQQVSALQDMPNGTIVLWEKLDRLVGDADVSNERALSRFSELIRDVEAHVCMVFHRFMSGTSAVSFFINGQLLKPWDPFLASETATQRLQAESVGNGGSMITIEPYILPHHSRLTPDQHGMAGGPGGWNAQQGFYVYRNRRLLLAGDWLGLGIRKEEHYKLARISVDLPNHLDHEWEINVSGPVPIRGSSNKPIPSNWQRRASTTWIGYSLINSPST